MHYFEHACIFVSEIVLVSETTSNCHVNYFLSNLHGCCFLHRTFNWVWSVQRMLIFFSSFFLTTYYLLLTYYLLMLTTSVALIEDILLFSVSLPPGYALSRVIHCIQPENLFGSCLVIATIRIYFVFLIGVFCLLQVFYSDLKTEHTTSSLKSPSVGILLGIFSPNRDDC